MSSYEGIMRTEMKLILTYAALILFISHHDHAGIVHDTQNRLVEETEAHVFI